MGAKGDGPNGVTLVKRSVPQTYLDQPELEPSGW
jgi:hypothetical protein